MMDAFVLKAMAVVALIVGTGTLLYVPKDKEIEDIVIVAYIMWVGVVIMTIVH